MGLLGTVKRRALASRAAGLLRNDAAEWTTGNWIVDPVSGAAWEYDEARSTLGSVRRFLRDRALGTRNCKSSVCAEGALLLAFAADEGLGDDLLASSLLREFQADARDAAVSVGLIDDPGDWDGIPELNDGNADREDITKLLERMGGA